MRSRMLPPLDRFLLPRSVAGNPSHVSFDTPLLLLVELLESSLLGFLSTHACRVSANALPCYLLELDEELPLLLPFFPGLGGVVLLGEELAGGARALSQPPAVGRLRPQPR